MKTVNMHEAKTHLSKLVEAAMNGEPFIIARAGSPAVVVTALATSQQQRSRIGFLPDLRVPEDFDAMGQNEIEALFGGSGSDSGSESGPA
jgi:prevent-host-death family protein